MRNILALVAVLMAGVSLHAAQPSEASVRELLDVTETKRLVDQITVQADQMINNAITQASQGLDQNEAEKTILEKARGEMTGVVRAELDWSVLLPMYVKVYQDTFTQEEVDAMLSFYKSAAGRAVTQKLPEAMQKSMQAMQARMRPMMEKLSGIQERAAREIEQARVQNRAQGPNVQFPQPKSN